MELVVTVQAKGLDRTNVTVAVDVGFGNLVQHSIPSKKYDWGYSTPRAKKLAKALLEVLVKEYEIKTSSTLLDTLNYIFRTAPPEDLDIQLDVNYLNEANLTGLHLYDLYKVGIGNNMYVSRRIACVQDFKLAVFGKHTPEYKVFDNLPYAGKVQLNKWYAKYTKFAVNKEGERTAIQNIAYQNGLNNADELEVKKLVVIQGCLGRGKVRKC